MGTPKRLFGPGPVDLTNETVYTVPANQQVVVRHIHVSNPSAAAIDFTLAIGTDLAGVRLFDGYPIAADSVLDHWAYYVLAAAEIITAGASSDDVLVMTIDGDAEVV
jgi:hypothetical protein